MLEKIEANGVTEHEMVGWHLQLKGQGFEQTPRDSEGERSLVGCSPWGHKESDMIELQNNNCFYTHIHMYLYAYM